MPQDEAHLIIPTPNRRSPNDGHMMHVARPGYWSGNLQRWWATTSHWFWRGIWIVSGQDRFEHWGDEWWDFRFLLFVWLKESRTKTEGCFFFHRLFESLLEVLHFFLQSESLDSPAFEKKSQLDLGSARPSATKFFGQNAKNTSGLVACKCLKKKGNNHKLRHNLTTVTSPFLRWN